jgi:hypothetical protein
MTRNSTYRQVAGSCSGSGGGTDTGGGGRGTGDGQTSGTPAVVRQGVVARIQPESEEKMGKNLALG